MRLLEGEARAFVPHRTTRERENGTRAHKLPTLEDRLIDISLARLTLGVGKKERMRSWASRGLKRTG